MPYIIKDNRKYYEHTEIPNNAGELNFFISHMCKQYVQLHGKNYGVLNEVIGVLECAKLEVYRRVVAPYEDIKIRENGDI